MNDMPKKTYLAIGNKALRDRDYELATNSYKKALEENPLLSGIIKTNLKITQHRRSRPAILKKNQAANIKSHSKNTTATRFFNWHDENHQNNNPIRPTTSREITLRNFGAAFIGPVFASFFYNLRREIQKNKIKELFFLSREGYFLELAFKRILRTPEETKIKTKYLICSRTLLFKLTLAYPEQWENTLGHHYVGRMADFLKNRYAFSEEEIKLIRENSKTYQDLENKELNFETNKHVIISILSESKEQIYKIVTPKLEAYSRYLNEIGFGASGEAHIVDIGFSGTIQKLLSKIQESKIVGHYFLTTQKAENKKNLIFKGHIAEGIQSGTEPLLDRSLFMESVLTAPHGQTIDIGEESGKIYFHFGKETTAQQNFNELTAIIDGAIEYASTAIDSDAVMNLKELSNYYKTFTTQKNNFPEITRKLFDIDDSISGFGIINPIEMF